MTDRYDPSTHEDDWSEVVSHGDDFVPEPVAPWTHRPTTVSDLVQALIAMDPDTPLRFDFDPSFMTHRSDSMIDMYLRLILPPTNDRRSVVFLLSEPT